MRIVEVFHIEILDWRDGDFPELDIAIACGAGTYIRAIARDLGIVLQTYGTLAGLTRTESNGFHLADSLTLSDLETQLQAGTFQPITPDATLKHLPFAILPATPALKWCQGQHVSADPEISGLLRVYEEDGRFLGIAQSQDGVLIPQMVLEAIS